MHRLRAYLNICAYIYKYTRIYVFMYMHSRLLKLYRVIPFTLLIRYLMADICELLKIKFRRVVR